LQGETAKPDEAFADLAIATARRVRVKPWLESCALLVPPGDYALSGFMIKVAKSVCWVISPAHASITHPATLICIS